MTASLNTRRWALGALTCLTLTCALPAHALGRIGDVQVIDRDTSEILPIYRHRGEYWVAGRPGARYAVSIQNRQSGRLLGVVSVDGINAISGETAAFNQTGYVLDPWQSYRVTGWRKSDDEVAAFHFTASPASYAERTGRPGQIGVIGVALFRERVAPPAVSLPPPRREAPESPNLERQESSAPSPSASAKRGASADAMAESVAAPRLGTGHGAREVDTIGHTTFERRSPRPDEIVRIRYDSRENLIAMGVIPARPLPPRPNPFPSNSGYAPDPY